MEPWSTEQMTWRHALGFVFKLHLDSPASPPHLSVVIQNLWIAEDRPTLKKIRVNCEDTQDHVQKLETC